MRRTLDTNICSYILRRHPANMIERFGAAKLASARFSAAVEAWLAGFDVRREVK